MICYKCHQQMKKHIINNVIIDKCENCKGIWLDKNEFQKIYLNFNCFIKKEKLFQQINQQKLNQKNLIIYNMCPKCQVKQLKQVIFNGIYIDKCYNCDGIYFDYNELEKCIKNNKKLFFSKVFQYLNLLFQK